MAKSWFDYLPKPEYDRTFGVAKFRDATQPSDEEKHSWVQDAIKKFREATRAAEEKRMSQALEVKQREEAKVPAVQPLGIEARAVPSPRAPMAAQIQAFRDATEPKEAATGRGILSGIGAVTERVGSRVQAAREGMLNPEVPIIPSKHPGATEKFATEFRTRLQYGKDALIAYVNAGTMDETEAQRSWEQLPQKTLDDMAPETKKGRSFLGLNLSDIGLGRFMGRKVTVQDVYEAEKGLGRWTQTPLLPEEFYTPIERIPVVGEKAAQAARGLTTPVGVVGTALMPEATALMTAGELAGWGLGTPIEAGLEKAGLPTTVETPIGTWGPRGILQLGGAIGGPVIIPAVGKTALRGAAKVAEVAASPEMARNIGNFRQGIAKAFTEGEAGGLKPRVPEEPKWQLTNDVPTPAEINKKMAPLYRVAKMTAKQKREYNLLLAQKDLNELRGSVGTTFDDQMGLMDTIHAEVQEMGEELELRAVAQEYRPTQAPQFGTPERADWEAARAGRPHGVKPRTSFSGLDIEVLRTRLKVFEEFDANKAIMPIEPGAPPLTARPAEEPLLTRQRFTETGEIIEEPTYATESELAGIRPEQGRFGIGAGERPIETAGPMFAEPVSPDIASFRAATEITPGMSKAERLAQWKAGYKPEAPAPGPQPIGREQALARWRAGYEPERLATPERPTVETVADTQPVPPGTVPPSKGPPTSLGDAMSGQPSTPGGLLARFLDRMPGRDVGKSDWAKFEGGLGAEGKEIELWTRETQNLERKLGIKPGPERTPEKEAIIKALHGEGTVDPKYQPLVDRLQSFLAEHEQRTLADVPAFEKKMLPQYWPRGWRNPEVFSGGEPLATPTIRTGKLGPGQLPGTLRSRTLPKTFTEAVEMGGEPISWDPAQQIGLHTAELADYRYSQVVAELWKMETRATPKSVAPNSWQTPDYPAFQSRPYVTKEGTVGWSEPLVVSPEDFSLLENMLGRRPPGMEDVGAYVASVFKRIKVAGGFFQYFDLQNRALWRSATRGELSVLPAAVRAWGGTFIPSLRPKLWKALMADPVVKEGTEEGLQLVGGLDTWKRTMRAAIEPDLVLKFPVLGEIPTGKLPTAVATKVRAVQRGLNNIEGYLAGGLYDSAHPQFVSTVYKSIRAELANKYPNYTSRQVSALAADHTNVLMSSIPDWESVLGPRLRQLGRATAFSINENEAWLRQITRPVTSANRSLYLRQWSGYVFGTLAAAELINYGMTGKLLGQEQLAPIVLQDGRPTYNTRFARPQLDGLGPVGKLVGITGPQGRHIYLDLMGQADTPFRLFSPAFFVMSRLSTPLSVSVQELQSRTFFGQQPLETTGEKAGFAVEQGLIPIPAVGFGEERGRIGTGGAGIQAAGWNVSAESNAALLERLVPGWKGLTTGQKDMAAVSNPQVAAVRQQQLERGLERGQQWAETKQKTQQAADEFGASVLAAYNEPGITGADIMNSVMDFLQKRANQAEIRYAGVDFKANSDDQKLLDAYYEITMPDPASAAERNDFFDKQDAFIAVNPRVKELIRQNHQAIFSDPQMKALMAQIDAARDVRSEYYSIPAKIGITAEEEAELRPWATQAAAMKSAYHYSPRRALNELGLDAALTTRVLRYMNRADNPARARFWRQNPDKKKLYKQFYSELPLEVPEEVLAATG